MIIPHILSLDGISPDDIKQSARNAHEGGMDISECPFPAGSDAETRWRKEYIALDLQTEYA